MMSRAGPGYKPVEGTLDIFNVKGCNSAGAGGGEPLTLLVKGYSCFQKDSAAATIKSILRLCSEQVFRTARRPLDKPVKGWERLAKGAVRGRGVAEPALDEQIHVKGIRSKKIGRLFGFHPKGPAKFLLEEIWLGNGELDIGKWTILALRSIFYSPISSLCSFSPEI